MILSLEIGNGGSLYVVEVKIGLEVVIVAATHVRGNGEIYELQNSFVSNEPQVGLW
jgi:hypothetical protein